MEFSATHWYYFFGSLQHHEVSIKFTKVEKHWECSIPAGTIAIEIFTTPQGKLNIRFLTNLDGKTGIFVTIPYAKEVMPYTKVRVISDETVVLI